MPPATRRVTPLCCLALGLALMLPNRGTTADDLPAETRIIITKLKEEMKSKTVKVRVAAYVAMGELGEKAKGERRTLCQGFLDPNTMVQAAAADALKNVDEPMHKMALAIAVDFDAKTVANAGEMGKDAQPLIPLIHALAAKLSVPASNPGNVRENDHFHKCLTALVAIDPDDPDINKAVIGVLSNRRANNRELAMSLLPKLKNKKLGLGPVVAIASNPKETAKDRVTAISLVPELVDENTTPAAIKALEALRFEKDASVREAVAAAVKKLK